MTEHDDSDKVEALLRSADPWPVERPVDPTIAARAISLVEKELQMDSAPSPSPVPSRWRRRRPLVAAIAALVVVLGAGAAVVSRSGDDGRATQGSGRSLGSAMASCLMFSLENLARAPVAFDGTVTDIASDGRITFSVERWFRGGTGDTATARASDLVAGAPQLEGGVGFEDGGRYLVSGDLKDGVVVPAICGFTVEWTAGAADDWAKAFGA